MKLGAWSAVACAALFALVYGVGGHPGRSSRDAEERAAVDAAEGAVLQELGYLPNTHFAYVAMEPRAARYAGSTGRFLVAGFVDIESQRYGQWFAIVSHDRDKWTVNACEIAWR